MTSPAYWRPPQTPKRDLQGQTFGLLTVLREAPSLSKARWLVRCECGDERVVAGQDIVKGGKTHRSCKRKEST